MSPSGNQNSDRGCYLILLRLNRDKRLRVGRLGSLLFRKGYYLYVGSAMQGLNARISRHKKRTKKTHWHIDYLRQNTRFVCAIPIPGTTKEECQTAQKIRGILDEGPQGFGSSDCQCRTHLFYSSRNPVEDRSFLECLHQPL